MCVYCKREHSSQRRHEGPPGAEFVLAPDATAWARSRVLQTEGRIRMKRTLEPAELGLETLCAGRHSYGRSRDHRELAHLTAFAPSSATTSLVRASGAETLHRMKPMVFENLRASIPRARADDPSAAGEA